MIKKDGANTESVTEENKIAMVSASTLRPPGAPEKREDRLKMEPMAGGPVQVSLLGTPGCGRHLTRSSSTLPGPAPAAGTAPGSQPHL